MPLFPIFKNGYGVRFGKIATPIIAVLIAAGAIYFTIRIIMGI